MTLLPPPNTMHSSVLSNTVSPVVSCAVRFLPIVVCRHPLWRDLEIVDDPAATPRQKIAARLTKIEKSILQGCLDAVTTCAPCLGGCTVFTPCLYEHDRKLLPLCC
jgi:hypothetical protein